MSSLLLYSSTRDVRPTGYLAFSQVLFTVVITLQLRLGTNLLQLNLPPSVVPPPGRPLPYLLGRLLPHQLSLGPLSTILASVSQLSQATSHPHTSVPPRRAVPFFPPTICSFVTPKGWMSCPSSHLLPHSRILSSGECPSRVWWSWSIEVYSWLSRAGEMGLGYMLWKK